MAQKDFDYDPMNDILFKFIFGSDERKQITIDFLNVVLNREGKNSIREIEFQNVELLPQRIDEKMSRIDIFAVLDSNERIDIEMQCVNYHNIEKRTLFYWAQMFLHQDSIMTGEDYNALKPAVTVNILNYNFLPKPTPYSVYTLRENETNHKLTDALELYFLEVPKFQKKSVHEMSRIEKWIAFFSKKLSNREKEEIAMTEPSIQDAMKAADNFFLDEKAYHAYLNRQAAVWDYNSGVNAARKEGFNNGFDKGIDEGIDKGIETVAVNMIHDGEPFDKICKFTKLSLQRIRELSAKTKGEK